MRTAEGFAQRAGAALKPTVDAFAQPELAKQSQNQSDAGGDDPERLERQRLDRPQLLARPRPVGQEPRRLSRRQRRRGRRRATRCEDAQLALTTGIASTYADLASLYAQRDSLESALDIRTETAKLVAQRVAHRPRYAGRAEAGRSPHRRRPAPTSKRPTKRSR